MLFGSNKEKGNAGLSMAIAYFGSNGYTVSLPLNDTQDYDLIVDKEGVLSKVQVKATGQVSRSGVPIVSLRSCGGTNGSVYKTVIETKVDLLFVFCENKQMYLIPLKEISSTNSINLGQAYQKYIVEI